MQSLIHVVCVFTLMLTHIHMVCAHTHAHTHMWRPEVDAGCLPLLRSTLHIKTRSFTQNLASNELQRAPCLRHPSAGLTCFPVGAEVSNPGPQACVTSSVLTEPSLSSLFLFVGYCESYLQF